MTKEELASKLNGRQYREEITDAEEKEAKNDGLVVAFGASDDLLEFRGALYDEVGAYNGTTAYLDHDGNLFPEIDDDDREVLTKHGVLSAVDTKREKAIRVLATWDNGGYSWLIETNVERAVFDIMEDEEKYCRGIVIDLKNLGEMKA